MYKNKLIIIFSWAAVFLWLAFIFYLSNQPAAESNGLSKNITKVIFETIDKVIDLDQSDTNIGLVEKFNHLIRKYAHFTLYLVLGILVTNAMIISGLIGYKTLIYSLLFCIIYAISDEVHQLFVLGRSAQVTDVLIDSLGSFIGIGLYSLAKNF